MKSIRLLLVLLLVGALTTSFLWFKKNYVEIAGDIRSRVGNQLAKKYHMQFFGTSAGLCGRVEMVGFSFEVDRLTTKDEACSILIDAAETLLKALNENEQIRPYCVQYPLTVENVYISLILNQPKWEDVCASYSCIVAIHQSPFIQFMILDSKPKIVRSWKEPYEEVVARLKGS